MLFLRVFMFIVMAFLGLIGISVNFRKDDSHNPFKLSFFGYLFFFVGFIGFSLEVMFQINDYKDTLDSQQDLLLQHFQDSIQREFDKKDLVERILNQQASIDTLGKKLDEKDSINRALMTQNVNLVKLSSAIQKDEQGVLFQNKDLLEKISDFQEQVVLKDKRIDYLQKSVSAAKRGMYKSISFTGMISTGNPGGGSAGFGMSSGSQYEFFFRVIDTILKVGDAKKLLAKCNEGIKKHPEWMTPYYYKAVALTSLNQMEEAIQLMLLVEEQTVGDPEYTKMLIQYYKLLGDNRKMEQLNNSYKDFH